MQRIYLDNAATSWPKPESVYAAVEHYQRHMGAPAGRGVYAEAQHVASLVSTTRRAIARLVNVADERRVIFTSGGTESLNLAIFGLCHQLSPSRPHVVTTTIEHNSVLRPLRALQQQGRIDVTYVACDGVGLVDPMGIRAALRPQTRLIVLNHASNVTGALNDASAVGRVAREAGVPVLLDAAQTLGELPIDMAAWNVDLLAAPGHKGLLGPLGTGLLVIAPNFETRLQPLKYGGTGSHSELDTQPEEMPDRYEAGNLNVGGIVGLLAGIEFLAQQGIESVCTHTQQRLTQLLDGLQNVEHLRLFTPSVIAQRAGLVSLQIDGYDPQELAVALDAGYRIQARAGLHCAPLVHRALGTLEQGGTVRLSPGVFTTQQQIDTTVQALRELAATAPV